MDSSTINSLDNLQEVSLTEGLEVIRRRCILLSIIVVIGFLGSLIYTRSQIPLYRSNFLLLVKSSQSVPVVSIGTTLETGNRPTEIAILTSLPIIEQAISDIEDEEVTATKVKKNLTIRLIPSSDVLDITYVDSDPERLKLILDNLGQEYVNYNLTTRQSQASTAIRFIESQLPQIRENLHNATNKLRSFQEIHGVLDPQTYSQTIINLIQDVQRQVNTTNAKIRSLQQEESSIIEQAKKFNIDIEQVLTNSFSGILGKDESLKNKLQALEIELALSRLKFTNNSPEILSLESSRNELIRLLQEQGNVNIATGELPETESSTILFQDSIISEDIKAFSPVGDSLSLSSSPNDITSSLIKRLVDVRIENEVSTAQLSSFSIILDELNVRLSQIPELQQKFQELNRQVRLSSSTLDSFLQKLQDLKISEAQELPQWQIIQPPVIPTIPFSPNLYRNVVFGTIASLVLGFILAVGIDTLDSRIRSIDQIKNVTQLPILATFPYRKLKYHNKLKKGTQLKISTAVVQLSYDQRFSESARSLALNLVYSSADHHGKAFCITSSLPDEGKSLICFFAAKALSELGYRVLLIDSDFRNPSQHLIFRSPNAIGLSSIITNRVSFESARVKGELGFDFVFAGFSPPNPLSLLTSQNMKSLLLTLKKSYDFVLIDSPPSLLVTDTQGLVPLTDGIIYIISIGFVSRNDLKKGLNLFQQSQSNVVGIVVNQVMENNYEQYDSYYSKSIDPV